MIRILKNIYCATKNGILLYFAAIGTFFSLQYLALQYFTQFNDYVVYYSVEPVKSVFASGDPITFVSDYEIKRPVDLIYTDILRCKTSIKNDLGYYSSYISTTKEAEPTNRKVTEWRYGAQVPNTDSTCVLDSTQTIILPFNIQKNNKVTSEQFTIQQ